MKFSFYLYKYKFLAAVRNSPLLFQVSFNCLNGKIELPHQHVPSHPSLSGSRLEYRPFCQINIVS